jgi:glycosyltransferase involved in cell wall biosynthesis
MALALRVGLFTECYRPIINGVVASVDSLVRALRDGGHGVFCVTPRIPGYHERDREIVRVPSLPLPTPTAYRLTVPLLSRRTIDEVLSGASVVHTHSPFITGWMGLRLARRLRVPLVFTYHTQLEQYVHYLPFEPRLTRRAARRLTRMYANAADAVVVPTRAMEQRLRGLRVTRPIVVVPSGIDVARFSSGRRDPELRDRLGIPQASPLVLCISRLGREKNIELALAAFARLRRDDAHLLLVGDGPEREALEAFARRTRAARRIHFAGALPNERLPGVYASAEAFVFPSLSETQGLVLAEALAAGLPIVAVDTPQTREVVLDAARLVPDDAQALAEALEQVLDQMPGKRLAGGAERFDAALLAGRIVEVYRELTAA